MATGKRIKNPVLFVCDLQEKFRPAIHEFPAVLATTQKMLRASKLLDIPILATTQLRAKLGETCSELGLDDTYPTTANVDKTYFSMWVPEIVEALEKLQNKKADTEGTKTKGQPLDILIVGIESHVCVLQTAMDAIAAQNNVYIIQDGVSSCNLEERNVALQRLREEGAKVTTSESILFECITDANDPRFKDFARLVHEFKDSTKDGLQALCRY